MIDRSRTVAQQGAIIPVIEVIDVPPKLDARPELIADPKFRIFEPIGTRQKGRAGLFRITPEAADRPPGDRIFKTSAQSVGG